MPEVTTSEDPPAAPPGASPPLADRRRQAAACRLPFPQPSPLFVGRNDDRARCLRLLERSPLLLTYGVPGIGKTEFVYRLVADLRVTPRWRKAQPLLVRARAGQSVEQLVAQLHFLVQDQRSSRGPKLPSGSGWRDDLVVVAQRLDRSAHLLFLDDVHHLDPLMVGELTSYLARRIGASRLLIASRREVTLAAETPPPTVVRLGALSAGETMELVTQLAECQGTSVPDGEVVLARTRGCPRRLHQLIIPSAGAGEEDELAQTLHQLRPASRRLLILARLLAGKLPVEVWLKAARQLCSNESELWTLAHHHLVDITQWTVCDLVWNAIAAGVNSHELAQAHRLAAQLLLQQGQAAPVAAAEAALAAVEHQLAAGDPATAWDTWLRWTRSFQAAELGCRALGTLRGIRTALPELRTAMSLWAVRLLLRQGQLEQAQGQLDEIGAGDPQMRALVFSLAGHIARRSGQLSRAEEHFCAALAVVTTADERLAAELRLAELAALRGETSAEQRITEALRQMIPDPSGSAASSRDIQTAGAKSTQRFRDPKGTARFEEVAQESSENTLRITCTKARVLLLSGKPTAAARVTEHTDLHEIVTYRQINLAALATLAYSGSGELAAAGRTLDRLCTLAARTGVPSAQAVALCQGIVLLTAGELPEARMQLGHAYRAFAAQNDLITTAVTALALGKCALLGGEFDEAARQLGESLHKSSRAGCAPLVGLASALRASALLAAGHTEAALALGTAVVEHAAVIPQARTVARYVLCRVYALAGDTASAAQQLESAATEIAATDEEILRAVQALEQAEFAATYGSVEAAISDASKAQKFFSERALLHETARAQLALAVAFTTRRAVGDFALAQEALGIVSTLATRHGYGPLLLGVALIEAALFHQRGDSHAAREQLQRGLDENPAAARGLYAEPLRAALATTDGRSGNTALLTRLGLLSQGECTSLIELRSASGRQLLTQEAAASESERFDLIVDLDRSEIRAGATGRRITGRPLMCAILAQLLTTCSEGADAEQLFREVWKGPEYHPLRHRNTIHVALTRLRQLLRELVPECELVATTPSGWRLIAPSRLCTLRCARS